MGEPELRKILRRMRITYRRDHNPPVWAAYYEPPGRSACYCQATTLEMMWVMLRDYFCGDGFIKPLYVEPRLMKHLTEKERKWDAAIRQGDEERDG